MSSALPAFGQAQSLPTFNIDANQTSVSGLSSGAYMAVQFHVAFSSAVKGAGIIAGGPYFCAQDDQTTATTVCSCAGLQPCQPGAAASSLPTLIAATDADAQAGRLDPTSHLAGSRVWMFSGQHDSVVPPPVMNALQAYYVHYAGNSNLTLRNDIPAQHAMPTDSFGNPCGTLGDPFINNCQFDAAGELLKWIYGPLNQKTTGALGGSLIQFDQSEFITAPASHGMWPSGWAYVPSSCANGALCRLHVVFHGCKQFPGSSYPSGPGGVIGDTYVKNVGYNAWADANDIIVLYPQANAMTAGTRLPRSNPSGCWDWWGYDDADYAFKTGRQMAAVKGMVDRIASGQASSSVPTGLSVVATTETSITLTWNPFAGATGFNLYRDAARANSAPVTAPPYTDAGLSSGTTYNYVLKATDAQGAESAPSAPAQAMTRQAGTCFTSSNFEHVQAGRAHDSFSLALANGSNQLLGLNNTFIVTTLKQTAPNFFVIGSCS